jgi:hypothetical protein
MPGVFNLAMKEIAANAWNAALSSAESIVNVESDQNKAMDLICGLKYYKHDVSANPPVSRNVRDDWESDPHNPAN